MKNLENVLAIELMTASQALEFLKPLKPGKGTGAAYREVRKVVKPLNGDRLLHTDLKKVASLVKDDVILKAVEKEIKLI